MVIHDLDDLGYPVLENIHMDGQKMGDLTIMRIQWAVIFPKYNNRV
jgi:hypothetical protein